MMPEPTKEDWKWSIDGLKDYNGQYEDPQKDLRVIAHLIRNGKVLTCMLQQVITEIGIDNQCEETKAAIALAESLAAELDAIREAGDEELSRESPDFADSHAEELLIRDLNRNADIAITRGRERDAALQRVKELEGELKERQDILDQIDWTSQIGGC